MNKNYIILLFALTTILSACGGGGGGAVGGGGAGGSAIAIIHGSLWSILKADMLLEAPRNVVLCVQLGIRRHLLRGQDDADASAP